MLDGIALPVEYEDMCLFQLFLLTLPLFQCIAQVDMFFGGCDPPRILLIHFAHFFSGLIGRFLLIEVERIQQALLYTDKIEPTHIGIRDKSNLFFGVKGRKTLRDVWGIRLE